MWHPLSITVVESNPASVVSYNVEARAEPSGDVIAHGNYPADPSGTTELPVGAANGILDESMVGRAIRLYVQQVGTDGGTVAFQAAGDDLGHGIFTVSPIADGAESVVVNF